MKVETSWLEDFRYLIQMIRNNNGEARFVGGCVRDTILGSPISDIDLATTLKPEEAMAVLKASGFAIIPTGLKHGTFTTLVDSKPVEITTLRHDLDCDGRHAIVSFTESWKEDAQRRDFTFNALYMDIDGNVYDYFSGLEDLKHRRLKFVGDPCKRIEEDYLRILRVFRFQTYICRHPISQEILQACTKYREWISLLSGERVHTEMFKLLSYPDFFSTVLTMQEAKILEKILGTEICPSQINNEKTRHISDPIAALALLIRNTPDLYDLKWLYSRWRFSKKIYHTLSTLLKEECITCIKKTLANLGNELTEKLLKILYVENKLSDKQCQEFMLVTSTSEKPIFPVLGRDLIPLGYSGPEIGKKLRQLKTLWEKSDCTLTKEELLSGAHSR